MISDLSDRLHNQVATPPTLFRYMSNLAKQKKQYKEFMFRCRYDHFLRFRLTNASRDEIIDIARDLGFNLNRDDLSKKKKGKKRKSPTTKRSSFIHRFLVLIQGFLGKIN